MSIFKFWLFTTEKLQRWRAEMMGEIKEMIKTLKDIPFERASHDVPAYVCALCTEFLYGFIAVSKV